MLSILIEITVLTLLSVCWLGFHAQVTKSLSADVFHVALNKRDLRKAKFYFTSVWTGIIAAFLSARCLEAAGSITFDSTAQRTFITGCLRGVEMWGLLVVAAVWSRVGQRVTHPNSDGKSLLPSRQTNTDSNQ